MDIASNGGSDRERMLSLAIDGLTRGQLYPFRSFFSPGASARFGEAAEETSLRDPSGRQYAVCGVSRFGEGHVCG
jgi:hypothetical protein